MAQIPPAQESKYDCGDAPDNSSGDWADLGVVYWAWAVGLRQDKGRCLVVRECTDSDWPVWDGEFGADTELDEDALELDEVSAATMSI